MWTPFVPSPSTSTGSMFARSFHQEDAEFDITAMVDLVFMMNIYFLVTFVTVASGAIQLPSADHCAALDADTAVVVTVLSGGFERPVTVYLADGEVGEPLTDPLTQERRIHDLLAAEAAKGKTAVLLKAEKNVNLGELYRIAMAASIEGVKLKLYIAVMEKDTPS